jgi:hypothetical protein
MFGGGLQANSWVSPLWSTPSPSDHSTRGNQQPLSLPGCLQASLLTRPCSPLFSTGGEIWPSRCVHRGDGTESSTRRSHRHAGVPIWCSRLPPTSSSVSQPRARLLALQQLPRIRKKYPPECPWNQPCSNSCILAALTSEPASPGTVRPVLGQPGRALRAGKGGKRSTAESPANRRNPAFSPFSPFFGHHANAPGCCDDGSARVGNA